MPGLSTRSFLLALQPLVAAASGQTPTQFADANETTWVQYILGDARYASLVAQITATVTLENRAIQLIADWYVGTATGGPNNNGQYPLRNSEGIEYLVPSPALLAEVMEKGDQGNAAVHGFGFYVQYHMGPSEEVMAYVSSFTETFAPTLSRAKAGLAATASTVITIKKNGAAWGTITFAAAGTTGTWVIAAPTIVAGDVLTFHAPSTPDATLGNIAITLAGAL